MKKNYYRTALCLLSIIVLVAAMRVPASADETSNKSDPLVSLSYVNEVLKPQIISEILSQLEGGSVQSTASAYIDIDIAAGKILKIGKNCEFIYRGGGAVVITASSEEGEGITDMSEQTELFSGSALKFGHVYYASLSECDKFILVTGDKAYFTIRGFYEVG